MSQTVFFWCCKSLGLRCLRYLLSSQLDITIVGLGVSSRDNRFGQIVSLAQAHNIPCYVESQPIPAKKVDLGLCIGYPQKIPLSTLNQFKHSVINLHFAPLPRYRGSGTLTHAIINQEKKYGVTFHIMEAQLDTGPILAIKWIPLDQHKTAAEITTELEQIAFTFFTEKISQILDHTLIPIPQAEIIHSQHITPLFCTKQSVRKLYKISRSWSWNKQLRYLRALTTGKALKPYYEENGQKIYLSLTE